MFVLHNFLIFFLSRYINI